MGSARGSNEAVTCEACLDAIIVPINHKASPAQQVSCRSTCYKHLLIRPADPDRQWSQSSHKFTHQMAAEPTVFQVFNETPGSRKTKYDYTSVQTLYDPGKAQSDHGRREQKSRAKTEANYNYKPTALRTWFLLFVVAFLLGCVAAAEYALRKEPSTSEVYKNTTSSLSNRDSPSVAPKGWLGAAWGNNLAPDGKPRAQGLPRMDRGDFGLVERVPGSNAFMPTGLTTRTSRVMPMSQTKEIPTSRTITTERTVLVTITPPAETSKDRKPTSTGKTEGRHRDLGNVC